MAAFPIADVWDTHRDRNRDIPEEREDCEGYGVGSRDVVSHRGEPTAAIAIGLRFTIAYADLLWYKWLP